ncbi:MAG: hypothetical protein QME59_05820 [Candidatus Hydrothermarchaeota archaeon]|nr:hypothetical protein [Candidatus Hydrothermarchaeota archaeon]
MKEQAKKKIRKTVVLCLPHYRSLSFKYMTALINLLLFKQDKYSIKSAVALDALYVDFNRNIIARDALKQNADYMFWLDSDMVVEGDTILKLMEHDKDIVSGLYFKKRDLDPVMYVRRGNLYESLREWGKTIFKVDAAGMGCALIKSEVFRSIKPPWFVYSVRENKGEDIYFCEKAREAGYDIWVDPAVLPAHLTEKEIGMEEYLARRNTVR